MTKKELVTQISVKTNINESETLKAVDALMEVITETMLSGESVFLRGFGTFSPKHRKKKTGRNIKANTFIQIPAYDFPHFKAAPLFKKAMKEKTMI